MHRHRLRTLTVTLEQRTHFLHCALLTLLVHFAACTNNPYRPSETGRNIYYDTFSGEPKHLDPARAYSEDEYEIMNQIYEPVVQYHFLKRPYVLEPLTATTVPEAKLYGKDGNLLSTDAPAEAVARVVYEITLRSDVRYQEHPAFAQPPTARTPGTSNQARHSQKLNIQTVCLRKGLVSCAQKIMRIRSSG